MRTMEQLLAFGQFFCSCNMCLQSHTPSDLSDHLQVLIPSTSSTSLLPFLQEIQTYLKYSRSSIPWPIQPKELAKFLLKSRKSITRQALRLPLKSTVPTEYRSRRSQRGRSRPWRRCSNPRPGYLSQHHRTFRRSSQHARGQQRWPCLWEHRSLGARTVDVAVDLPSPPAANFTTHP